MEGKEWRWTQTYAVLKIGNGEERRREEEEKGEGVGLYSPEGEQDGKEQRIKRPDWSRAPRTAPSHFVRWEFRASPKWKCFSYHKDHHFNHKETHETG